MFVVSIIIAFNVIIVSSLLITENIHQITAKASDSHVYLCINEEPVVTHNCPAQINQSTAQIDNTQTCQVNATDPNNNTLNYSLLNVPTNITANIDTDGEIIFNATQDGVGNRSFTIRVADPTNCPNSIVDTTYNFEVLDINDAPEYVLTIPNTEFTSGTSVSPISLADYFTDADGDTLNYTVLGANLITVTITQSNGNVLFSSSECGTDYLLFTAQDPYNASATSGLIEVESTCFEAGSSSESGSGGGSSSGGGGGSSSICRSKWECKEWSECYINGTQSKKCIDINGCKANDYIRYFWQDCTYIPTCYDGIQNGDETGIDCGGSCKPCGTCTDGILNNLEEEIDCGGPNCKGCHNCEDGIQNYDEQGIDCGGEFCSACATCEDGIQNGDETGIDCGGSCKECAEIASPAFIEEQKSIITNTLIAALIAVIIALIIFKLYHKQIKQMVARFGWLLVRKHRKEILFTNEQKSFFISKIAQAQANSATNGLDELAGIARRMISTALNMDFEFYEHELGKHLITIGHDTLKRIFISLYKKIREIEGKKADPNEEYTKLFAQELRQLVFQLSSVEKEDLVSDAGEKEIIGTPLEKTIGLIYNTLITLQFEETSSAKEHYLNLIVEFEKLSETKKSVFFEDINRLYQEIKYQTSWVKA